MKRLHVDCDLDCGLLAEELHKGTIPPSALHRGNILSSFTSTIDTCAQRGIPAEHLSLPVVVGSLHILFFQIETDQGRRLLQQRMDVRGSVGVVGGTTKAIMMPYREDAAGLLIDAARPSAYI
ncbi:hypothetical protein FS749_000297 [Ceratobasidium sp. UAMH 11750]|nr:hypothetical protein FS749_000297 [Ceratobasidium sp. UAMH 11750]